MMNNAFGAYVMYAAAADHVRMMRQGSSSSFAAVQASDRIHRARPLKQGYVQVLPRRPILRVRVDSRVEMAVNAMVGLPIVVQLELF